MNSNWSFIVLCKKYSSHNLRNFDTTVARTYVLLDGSVTEQTLGSFPKVCTNIDSLITNTKIEIDYNMVSCILKESRKSFVEKSSCNERAIVGLGRSKLYIRKYTFAKISTQQTYHMGFHGHMFQITKKEIIWQQKSITQTTDR